MNVARIEMGREDTSTLYSLVHTEEDQVIVGDSSEEATTTGDSSDNDSASESDGESARNAGRKRQVPPTAGDIETKLAPNDVSCSIDPRSRWQSQSVQQPQRRRRRFEHHQPLPRKAYHTTPASADLARESLPPPAGRDNLGIEENARLGQRAMGPAQRAVIYQGHRLQDSSRRTQKSPLVTMTPRGSQAPGGTSTALKPLQEGCMAGGMLWKKRISAPVKAANSKASPPRRPVPSACAHSKQREGSADIAAELIPPSLPKGRMASSVAGPIVGQGSRNIISRADNSSGSSDKNYRLWPRLIPSTLPRLAQEERSVAAAAATKRGIIPDLSCHEVFDVDAVMNPGEVRTPICRYLLPCWPEGVEGYEEVGGWRRLGGTTRDASQRGRRSV